jgi:class 3 adenylate cyclase
VATAPAPHDSHRQSPVRWLRSKNHSPDVVKMLRRARRVLPGDPDFGDPLSTAGDGGPRAAARAASRLLGEDAASREVSLGALQVWQALTEKVSRQPANAEMTLVFTDLVKFSEWSLKAGDDAALTLLRRVARAVEPPLLESGGSIVKRMGDGIMAVFGEPFIAVRAACAAEEALHSVDVDGYTPRMRVGIHTGRPQRLAADWLGVDVNIAARVMERATKGGIMVSSASLDKIPQADLDRLGVVAKRAHRPLFGGKPAGIPADMAIYRLHTGRELTVSEKAADAEPQA